MKLIQLVQILMDVRMDIFNIKMSVYNVLKDVHYALQ